MPRWIKFILSFVICFGVAYLGSLATDTSGWYDTLKFPAWKPTKLTFPIVWNIIFACMSISLWLVWKPKTSPSAYIIFGVQLLLNLLWSPVFFQLHSIFGALWIAAFLWLAVFANLIIFGRTSQLAAWLLVPYLLWATFAFALNLNIYLLNS
ncbi:MAG: tryptophan-rich sensory protein [Simkaniaceae bacterium]|nr:tryptophan-rich sensory protein [Simkaniaceae bacterium]